MYASPHITFEEWQKGQFSDIDIFEDQLRTWLFEQARAISPNQHSGPAILALITPYFEVVSSYLQGQASKGAETAFLRNGLKEVFVSVDSIACEKYVTEVRHGFAHEAMFRRVILHRALPGLPSFGMINDELALDPWWVLDQAEAHFNYYVARLRSNEPNVIQRFREFMAIRKAR